MKRISQLLLVLSLVILFKTDLKASDEFMQVRATAHISSTVSDGKLSIAEIVEIAKRNNIKVVIITDRDFMRWEYGLWPLRRIIKKTVVTRSVATYGIKQYLKEIDEVQKRNPDIVLIPGVESASFYYWEGNLFRNNLKLYNWHKHMLVIGLENVGDYRNIPSVSNPYSLALPFRFKDIIYLWPILILIIGILCLRKREFKYKDSEGHRLGPYSKMWQVLGIILIIFGLIFLYNNLPFYSLKYDQYHGDQGVGPYQNLIEYVSQKGGLTFWAHPEAGWTEKVGSIGIETKKHSGDLLEASNYTGFSIFWEGYWEVGYPGGIWDTLLKEYCEGKRKMPVWAIGGLAFDQAGDLNTYINELLIVLLVRDLSRHEVLRAMKEGRMYVVCGKMDFVLDRFIIEDSLSDTRGIVAGEIDLKGKPILRISGYFIDGKSEAVKVNLIREGTVIKTFEVTSPFSIEYEDDYYDRGKKIYYRLEVHSPGSTLVTNPIFVNL